MARDVGGVGPRSKTSSVVIMGQLRSQEVPWFASDAIARAGCGGGEKPRLLEDSGEAFTCNLALRFNKMHVKFMEPLMSDPLSVSPVEMGRQFIFSVVWRIDIDKQ